MQKQIITITEDAVTRIKYLLSKRGKETLGLKVSVKSGGCSGISYSIEYADKNQPLDEVISYKGVTIVIDAKAIMYLIGSKMDYVEDVFKSGFVFVNPNEKVKCGCGKSFNV